MEKLKEKKSKKERNTPFWRASSTPDKGTQLCTLVLGINTYQLWHIKDYRRDSGFADCTKFIILLGVV
jgi:hypothetical protein